MIQSEWIVPIYLTSTMNEFEKITSASSKTNPSTISSVSFPSIESSNEEKKQKKTNNEIQTEAKDFRERMGTFLNSDEFMISLIILIVIDCLIVIAEILLEKEEETLPPNYKMVPHILHCFGIGILSVFLMETVIRIYVLRCHFIQKYLEVFDATVVVVSFGLDIYFLDEEKLTGTGLIIILRLWRISRVINGIVLTSNIRAEKVIESERIHHQKQLQRSESFGQAALSELKKMQNLLRLKGIKYNVKLPEKTPSVGETSNE